jgi:NADH:ubiquinone oxidoreductase subunit 4 (subunit M)
MGFAGRWLLYLEAFSRGWVYAAGVLLATGFFLLAMVRALWPALLPTGQTVALRRPPPAVLLLIGALIAVLLALGLYPHSILAVLGEATTAMGMP